MKYFVIAALAAVLIGCGATPIAQVESGNKEVTAAKIARVEGCVVYRLRDGSERTVYFMRCPQANSTAAWDETHSNGKQTWTEHHQTDTQ